MRVPGPDEDHVFEHRRLRGFHAMTTNGRNGDADPAFNWCRQGPTATFDVRVGRSANRLPWRSASRRTLSVNGPPSNSFLDCTRRIPALKARAWRQGHEIVE